MEISDDLKDVMKTMKRMHDGNSSDDFDDGDWIVFVNDALCKRYGWNQEQLIRNKIPFVLNCIRSIEMEGIINKEK